MDNLIDSSAIGNLFGTESTFFQDSINYLNQLRKQLGGIFAKCYENWINTFKNIYNAENLDQDLFLYHSYFYYLLTTIVSSYLEQYNFNKLKSVVEKKLKDLQLSDLFNWVSNDEYLPNSIDRLIKKYEFKKEDLFFSIYQEIVNPSARHERGEYYTPYKLARLMIEDVYSLGLKVIDCSCGSGVFLVEIIHNILNSKTNEKEKIEALNNIYGLDINPIAVLTSLTNLILNTLNFTVELDGFIPELNLFRFDSLNPEQNSGFLYNSFENKFDLIIGNPPWLTYKDISDKEYQITLRNLAGDLDIKPKSQYITHIELAALFFYQTSKLFLKDGGTIFLIVTKSLLTGDHCYEFRAFKNYSDLEVWDFEDYSLFNMDFVILKANYRIKKVSDKKFPVSAKIFNANLKLAKKTQYIPIEAGKRGAKSFVPIDQYNKLNKMSESFYKSKFFQGATLVPRALVFFSIDKLQEAGSVLVISPDLDSLKQSKEPWNDIFYTEEKIEKIFHFITFLNKDLVPFGIKKYRNAFLPINQELEFNREYLEKFPLGKTTYFKLDEIYQRLKKKTSDISTLIDNLNYWNKITKQNANKRYLVVYNASGSNIKSAVINNEVQKVIIGSENYYFYTDLKEEAYYIASVLNSLLMSQNIKIVKSSRHIHKRPLDFPIPEYDPKNTKHKKLSSLGIQAEKVVSKILEAHPDFKPGIIREKIRTILSQIDDFVQMVF